jgi:nucleotide-binding universal stress UspA family protein
LAVKGGIVSEGPIRRILVATLGSPWSERAFEYAVRLAKAYALELVIVAVVTPTYRPEKGAVWGLALTANMQEELRRHAKHVLEKASALARDQSIASTSELREGRAAEEILKAAEQHQCDLVIIGSRGMSGVSRVTLGETGNEVVLKAVMPVVVVK